jgi:hypothetical protein
MSTQKKKKSMVSTGESKSKIPLKKKSEEEYDEESQEQKSDSSFVGITYGLLKGKVNGQLAISVLSLSISLVILIVILIMWNRLSSSSQYQEQILYVCSSFNSDQSKASEIPNVKGDKNPQDYKTRFNAILSDLDGTWSKAGSYYLIKSTGQYRVVLHSTIKLNTGLDKVNVRILGDVSSPKLLNGSITSAGGNYQNKDGILFYHTTSISPEKILTWDGNVTEVVQKYQDVEIDFFATIYGNTRVFVSITQTEDSEAQLYNVEDCGANYFYVTKYI